MKKSPTKSLKKDERGIVTIIITILIMLLLTLIVLAMSRNANREQRQALDRQLNSQAFYAAESGINDTIKYISNPTTTLEEKDTCDAISNSQNETYPGVPNQLDSVGPISYSCVMYDKTPSQLSKDVTTSQSWVTEIKGDGTGINTLTFNWSANQSDNNDNLTNCVDANRNVHLNVTEFTNTQNCKAGYLRVELINPDAADRQAMIDQNMVVFLAPGDTPSAVTRADNDSAGAVRKAGTIYTAQCSDTSGVCTATISGIGLANPGERLLMRVKSFYRDNHVEVTGAAPTTGAAVQFADAQAMIDSTGKANDVLKRLKVYVPLQNSYYYPEFAIQTNDKLCKKLNVLPTNVTDTCN